jgi:hypothetical protein
MSDFADLPEEIAAALEDAGVNATLQHISTGTGMRYNTQTGSARPARSPHTLRAPVTTCRKALTERSGLQAGDIKITAPASAFAAEPTESDHVVFKGRRYSVVAVVTSYLGDVAISHTIQARRP